MSHAVGVTHKQASRPGISTQCAPVPYLHIQQPIPVYRLCIMWEGVMCEGIIQEAILCRHREVQDAAVSIGRSADISSAASAYVVGQVTLVRWRRCCVKGTLR